jgi:hypothetical protein
VSSLAEQAALAVATMAELENSHKQFPELEVSLLEYLFVKIWGGEEVYN